MLFYFADISVESSIMIEKVKYNGGVINMNEVGTYSTTDFSKHL